MRKLVSALLTTGTLLMLPVATDAAVQPAWNDGVYHTIGLPAAETVQLYVYGGHHWCWYDDAWSGPGWYWCGYRWHRGFGWGGGIGFHGWGGGHGGGFHGGGHAGGHSGGFHGGGHSGGHAGGHGGGHGGDHHH
jgi:hypothetical protein